jgi:hypothetical protein
MTVNEFLRLLARTPRDWRVERGKIRRGPHDDPDCPITAVARLLVGELVPAAGGVNRAAYGLDLDVSLASQIVAATDDLPFADPALRTKLLAACGLTHDEETELVLQLSHTGGCL